MVTTAAKQLTRMAGDLYELVTEGLAADECTVFLGGSAIGQGDQLRDLLRGALAVRHWARSFEVYYPEDIFEDVLWQPDAPDLLGLENFLAEWVHVVVLIAEGPGAICELGAFANHPELRDKMVVLVDEEYKSDRSFIMRGPVRFLEKSTKSHIIYHTRPGSVHPYLGLGKEVRSSIYKIAREQDVVRDMRNPVIAQLFLLTAIYCGEGLHEKALLKMLGAVAQDTRPEKLKLTLQSALGALLGRREVQFADDQYLPTQEGYERLQRAVASGRRSRTEQLDVIDRVRSEVLVTINRA